MYFYEKLLRETIEQSGQTLRDVGRAIGVPATTLNDWLISGTRPHLKNLIRLSEWSGHSVPALLVDIDADSIDERIIILLQLLTPGHKQQAATYIESLLMQQTGCAPNGRPAGDNAGPHPDTQPCGRGRH